VDNLTNLDNIFKDLFCVKTSKSENLYVGANQERGE